MVNFNRLTNIKYCLDAQLLPICVFLMIQDFKNRIPFSSALSVYLLISNITSKSKICVAGAGVITQVLVVQLQFPLALFAPEITSISGSPPNI